MDMKTRNALVLAHTTIIAKGFCFAVSRWGMFTRYIMPISRKEATLLLGHDLTKRASQSKMFGLSFGATGSDDTRSGITDFDILFKTRDGSWASELLAQYLVRNISPSREGLLPVRQRMTKLLTRRDVLPLVNELLSIDRLLLYHEGRNLNASSGE